MESYTGFASLYDLFMDNIPYKEWSLYLIDLLKEHNITDGIILDLGCGTGNITQLLAVLNCMVQLLLLSAFVTQ